MSPTVEELMQEASDIGENHDRFLNSMTDLDAPFVDSDAPSGDPVAAEAEIDSLPKVVGEVIDIAQHDSLSTNSNK